MNCSPNRQEKFAAYFSQKNDYLYYVGVPTGGSLRWIQVYQFDGVELIGLNSWLVTYPRTGEIVDGEQIYDPLPEGITGNLQQSPIDIPLFTQADLIRGRKIVEIEFAPSPTHPGDDHYYLTRLINRSNQKVKCLMFGAYTRSGGKFNLNTVIRRPFTAAQFTEWYAVEAHGWLSPGGIAATRLIMAVVAIGFIIFKRNWRNDSTPGWKSGGAKA